MTSSTFEVKQVPLPEVRGPLPDTRDKGVMVWDVSKLGYVAEEYFISGKADVYEPVVMSDAKDASQRDTDRDLGRRQFDLELLRPAEPYTTRLVVYRPADQTRFSGNVIVEPFHLLGGGVGVVWNSIHHFFVKNGDAYVGFQHPITVAGLKRFGEGRYAELEVTDNTQLWDGLAQTAALLKSGTAASPLRGYRVRDLLLTGISYTGVATSTFANFHHGIKKTADGRNLFDGYVSMENATYDRPIDVPLIKVNTQGDFNSFGAVDNRRPDGDEPGQRYRLYEVPGWPHVSGPRPAPSPTAEPPTRLGAAAEGEAASNWLRTTAFAQFPKDAQSNDFPGFAFSSGAFANMYAWLREGRPPPRAPRIETNPDASAKLDRFGNALGGLRSPYVDVPIATYAVGTGYPGFLFGYKVPFDLAQRRELHGSHAAYVKQVEEHVARLLAERFILADAAAAIMLEARQSEPF